VPVCEPHAPYTSPCPSVPRQFSVSDATEGRVTFRIIDLILDFMGGLRGSDGKLS
jgi:hypothetical protein